MKTKKAEMKREKILAAAAKVFKDKGYAEATLSDVALEAGTFAGSMYYYFDSKDHLVEAVLNLGTTRVTELVVAEVRKLPKTTSPLDTVKVALRSHLTLVMERDDFALAYWKIIDQVPPDVRKRHAAAPRAYGRFWKGLIENAQKAGKVRGDLDPRIVSLLLLGSTLYALDWFDDNGKYSVADLADILLTMTIEGISAPGGRASAVTPLPSRSKAPAMSARAPRKSVANGRSR